MWYLSSYAGLDIDPEGVVDLIYENPDQELYLWYDNDDEKYYISEILGKQLQSSGWATQTFTKQMSGYDNGKQWYKSSGYYLWADAIGTTFYITTGLGYFIREWQDPSTSTWYGDNFWSSSSLIGSYDKGGALKNGSSTLSLAYKTIEGWQSDTMLGIYTPVVGSSVTGNKYVGWKQLVSSPDLGNLTQQNIESNGEYIFRGDKDVWYDGSNWIISAIYGTKDADVGYWLSATLLGDYDLYYTGGGTTPTPETYTVSFDEYVNPEHQGTVKMAQASVWR